VRIALFWTYYDAYLRSLYSRQPNLAGLPYEQQLEEIISDRFSWPAQALRHWREAGHQVFYVLSNAGPLQRAWARETGIPFNEHDWQFSIPSEQVRRFKPDVLWISSMFQYYGDYLRQIRRDCRRVFAWIACPLPDSLDLMPVDCILTSHMNFVEHFRGLGKCCHRVLPAFDESIPNELREEALNTPVSFIGGFTAAHSRRREMLNAVANQVPLHVWGYGVPETPRITGVPSLLRRVRYERGSEPLFRRAHGEVWGLDMYRVLRQSRMTVNVHIDVAGGLAGNQRMFEATGVGTLLLTEDAPNLRELFEPDAEVAAYRDADDLAMKVRHYLRNETERRQVAAAGQRRTLKYHSVGVRSEELAALFEQHLSKS
jgi:spore maturation protein CgeB